MPILVINMLLFGVLNNVSWNWLLNTRIWNCKCRRLAFMKLIPGQQNQACLSFSLLSKKSPDRQVKRNHEKKRKRFSEGRWSPAHQGTWLDWTRWTFVENFSFQSPFRINIFKAILQCARQLCWFCYEPLHSLRSCWCDRMWQKMNLQNKLTKIPVPTKLIIDWVVHIMKRFHLFDLIEDD